MKKCIKCGAEFESRFRFCPIDGRLLVYSDGAEIHLTLIENNHLAARLGAEFKFVCSRVKSAWPKLKGDPKGFMRAHVDQLLVALKGFVTRPYRRPAIATALLIIVGLILAIAALEKRLPGPGNNAEQADDLVQLTTLTIPGELDKKSDNGIGSGENSRVGFSSGRGEGSNPMPARAHGGGGGGTRNPLPQSQGRPPIPSPIPAPIPTTYARLPPPALPEAGLNIDPVLWKNLNLPAYGDPRSKATTSSNGPGEGGGVGNNNGTGIGEGDGPGFGPGRKGNIGGGDNSPGCCGQGGSRGNNPNPNEDPDRIYKASEVTRARIITKPEPQYTEEARKGGVIGTVVLRVVFSKTGQVTNIQAVQTLCCGLTERAIAAAKQIRFTPATRNGQAVSMYMQLEYNFNLY